MQVLLYPFSINSNIIYSFAQDTYLGLSFTHFFLAYPHSTQRKILPTYPQSAFWVQPLLILCTADIVAPAKSLSHTNLIGVSATVLSSLHCQFNTWKPEQSFNINQLRLFDLSPPAASLDPQHPESSPRPSRPQDLSSGNFSDFVCNHSVHRTCHSSLLPVPWPCQGLAPFLGMLFP